MDIATAAPYVVGLVTITATIILVSRDWRVSISAMGAQYVGVLLLVALSWPLELAVIKLIAGWIAAASLGISLIENPKNGLLKTRPFMLNLPFFDADYCIYGKEMQKPTRFWSNLEYKGKKYPDAYTPHELKVFGLNEWIIGSAEFQSYPEFTFPVLNISHHP